MNPAVVHILQSSRQNSLMFYGVILGFDIIIMITPKTQKLKIIENFCLSKFLLDLKYCEYWLAYHKISKKCFILKKIKDVTKASKINQNYSTSTQGEDSSYILAINEVKAVKKIVLQTKPKCVKLIKTNTNTYIAYQTVEGTPLSNYLPTTMLALQKKVTLAMTITQNLEQIRSQGYYMPHFTIKTINFINVSKILFTDWTFLVNQKNQSFMLDFLNNVVNNNSGIEEIKYEDVPAMQMKSLGQVLRWIFNLKQYKSQECTANGTKDLQALLEKFDDQNKIKRMTLNQVITTLKKLKIYCQEKQKQQLKEEQYKSLRAKPAVQEQKCLYKSNNVGELIQKKHFKKQSLRDQTRNSQNPQEKNNFQRNNASTESQTIHLSHKKKLIDKKRFLAFFLLKLHKSVFTKDGYGELSFLLMKNSIIIMKEAIFYTSQIFNQDMKQTQQSILAILQGELEKMLKIFNQLKQTLLLAVNEPQFFKELQNQNSIDQNYFSQKIRSYAWSELEKDRRKNKVMDCVSNSLVNVYMVLKKIEYGTYKSFWNDVYLPDTNLELQPFFLQVKMMSQSEVLHKIQKIMRIG